MMRLYDEPVELSPLQKAWPKLVAGIVALAVAVKVIIWLGSRQVEVTPQHPDLTLVAIGIGACAGMATLAAMTQFGRNVGDQTKLALCIMGAGFASYSLSWHVGDQLLQVQDFPAGQTQHKTILASVSSADKQKGGVQILIFYMPSATTGILSENLLISYADYLAMLNVYAGRPANASVQNVQSSMLLLATPDNAPNFCIPLPAESFGAALRVTLPARNELFDGSVVNCANGQPLLRP